MKDIKSHTRIIDSITGPHEKKLLVWIAERLPTWVTPNMMTGLGVLGAVIIFLGYILCNIHPAFLWLASFGFFVNWFGDSLDGTIARVRDIQRPKFGFFIDHTVDSFNIVLLFLGIGFSPFVHFSLAMIALIGYMQLSILVYIRTAVKGEFKISYGLLGATEARILAIMANTLVFFLGNPIFVLLGYTLSAYDLFASFVAILLFSMFFASSYTQAREIAALEKENKLN